MTATLNNFQSDVLLGGVQSADLGYSFEEVSVTIADGMRSGAVLEPSGSNWIWVVPANTANAAAVLLDTRADQETQLAAGNHTLVVARRGATINSNRLSFTAAVNATQLAAAVSALGDEGIKVSNKVIGNQ